MAVAVHAAGDSAKTHSASARNNFCSSVTQRHAGSASRVAGEQSERDGGQTNSRQTVPHLCTGAGAAIPDPGPPTFHFSSVNSILS